MFNPQAFATELRKDVLDAIEFCSVCSADLQYRPNHYRTPNDVQQMAADNLRIVMGYRDDQPEI